MDIVVGTNSYISLADANTYFDGRLHTAAWVDASDADRARALLMATRTIERLPVKGSKADPTQALGFPRYPDTEVPQAVIDACCELALAVLERGDSERRKMQLEGVQSFSIGGLSETFVTGAGRGLPSPEAQELLRPWLLGAVSII